MLKRSFVAVLIMGLCAVAAAQTCQVTHMMEVPGMNMYWPDLIFDSGNWLYVGGTNFIGSIENTNPAGPYLAGTTTNYSYSCGDNGAVAVTADMFPGDSVLFLATLCHGIHSYDTATQKINPPGKAFVEFDNAKAIAGLKTATKRYLVMPAGTQTAYADFTDLGNGSTVKTLELSPAVPGIQVDALQGFEHAGRVYLVTHSRAKGLKIYDVTNFPASATLIVENPSLKSYHGHHHNGRFYVTGMSGGSNSYGLHIYSVPQGTLLGQYTGRGPVEFADVRGCYADDQYAYLGLGNCAETGGVDIVNITVPSAMYSILPSGWLPTPCTSLVGIDAYAKAGGSGGLYMFLTGHTTQDVYQITCGAQANVVLQAASPASVDPGGTYPVTVTLRNSGTLAADTVAATLSTSHSKVTVNVPTTQSYGTLAAGASKSMTYSINVASDATASTIPFHLNITASTGSYSADFSVTINPPRPILGRTIRESATGQALEVEYYNSGNADYTGTFTVTLESWTTGVSFSPAAQTFGPIAKAASQIKTYPYTAGSGACSPLNFISAHIVNTDATIANDPAYVSVDLAGSAGGYPFVKYSSSGLSKAGETYTLSLTVQNVGTAPAQGLQVQLDAAPVTWLAGNVMNFGDLNANASATQSLTFTVGAGTTEATFASSAGSIQGCWAWAFNQSMLDVQLAYVDEWHCSFASRCMTESIITEGSAGAAKATYFWIKLSNTGTSDATGVSGTLSDIDGNANVFVTTPTSVYSVAAGAQSENNPAFRIDLNENYCSGDDATCPPLRLRLSVPDYGFTKDLLLTVKSAGGASTYSISGTVSGAVAAGVTMNLTGAATSSTTTGSTGNYTFNGLAAGAYTITPSLSGYTFNPGSSARTISNANISGVNFTASSGGTTYSISGAVSGAITSGVTMSLTGAAATTTTTGSTGSYTFANLSNGSYTVTPSRSGFTFAPSSLAVTVSGANQSGKNFTASSSAGDIILSYQRYTIDDTSGGDGDKVLEAGETALLYITLKNESSTALTAATATLIPADAGVTVNGTAVYSINQMQEKTMPFSIVLSGSYTKSTITFSMAVTGTKEVKNLPFTVAVGGGVPIMLSYQRYVVDDGEAGDGILRPGETAKLNVYLRNDSASPIASAAGRLTTAAAGVLVQGQGSYTLQPGETGFASFNVTVAEAYAENTIPFTISVTGASSVTGSPFSVAVGGAAGNALVIPVIARIQGAQGTNWKTDVQIHNHAASPVTLTLKLIRTGIANDTPPAASFELGMNQTLLFEDILAHPQLAVFQGNTLGSLLVEFTGGTPPCVATRIYNDLGELGTYGQSATAVLVDSRTRGTSGTVPSKLFGLRKTEQYRTNLGLVNVTAAWNTLQVDLMDAGGSVLGNPIIQTLAPYNMLQLNDVLGQAGVSDLSDAFMARVSSISSQDFISYASIADGKTGDASYISDQISGHPRTLVPGVGHTPGAANSNWKTDLSIFNPGSVPVTVRLTYFRYGYEGGGAMVRIGPIPALGSRILDDVLTEFSGLGESEAGFMVVEPENAVTEMPIVAARTYNYYTDPEKGLCTFGQYIPGVDFTAGGSNGQTMVITGLSSNEQFRLNLGLINADENGEALATASLHDTAGALLGTHAFYLPYKTMGLQLSTAEILDALGIAQSFENATLSVQVGGDNLFIYASSVDNITSDPVYLEPLID